MLHLRAHKLLNRVQIPTFYAERHIVPATQAEVARGGSAPGLEQKSLCSLSRSGSAALPLNISAWERPAQGGCVGDGSRHLSLKAVRAGVAPVPK